jgi:ribosomal protein L37AE/L43A
LGIPVAAKNQGKDLPGSPSTRGGNCLRDDTEEIAFLHESAILASSSHRVLNCPRCGYQWVRRRESNKITVQCPNCLKRFKNLSAPKHELLKSDLHSLFESLKKKYPEYSGSLEVARFISINIIKSNINSHNSDLLIQKILELIKAHSLNA